MTVTSQAEQAPAWPDTAGELFFALQRPHPAVSLGEASRPEETRLLRQYGTALAGPSRDEVVGIIDGQAVLNPLYGQVLDRLEELGPAELRARAIRRDRLLLADGVTFGGHGLQRRAPFPIDLMPRLLPISEWSRLQRGLEQRAAALTAFLDDVYGDQRILRAGVVPRGLVETSTGYSDVGRAAATGAGARLARPRATLVGTDLLHSADGRWLALEDNLRMPCGLGYALEARRTMATVLPELTADSRRQTVSVAPALLRGALAASAMIPPGAQPAIAVLSTGPSDSAWFEHRMLASAMKVPIVLPRHLIAVGDRVAVLRPDGPRRLDVLYRQQTEQDLASAVCATGEPLLPLLLNAVARGGVWVGNAMGNGVAEDKAVGSYVPAMIRYYLGEEPLLDGVRTLLPTNPADRREIDARLPELVIKPVDGSDADGVLLGPLASPRELAEARAALAAAPRCFVAQEYVDVSTHPTLTAARVEPRRVDLRGFTVCTPTPVALPSPLTRVALGPNSPLVASSLGGGAKDTWIVH
jgi:carboxylate-amine ligase